MKNSGIGKMWRDFCKKVHKYPEKYGTGFLLFFGMPAVCYGIYYMVHYSINMNIFNLKVFFLPVIIMSSGGLLGIFLYYFCRKLGASYASYDVCCRLFYFACERYHVKSENDLAQMDPEELYSMAKVAKAYGLKADADTLISIWRNEHEKELKKNEEWLQEQEIKQKKEWEEMKEKEAWKKQWDEKWKK